MSFFVWRDSGNTLQEFEKEVGDSGKEHPIHGLPSAIGTAIIATATSCATLVTSLGSVQTYVDGLETLIAASNTALTALQGYVDGLETLVGATNTALTALQGYNDGVETLIGSTNTKLDTLHTDLGVATVLYGGRKLVTTAGTRVALAASQAITKGVWVRALTTNLGLIYVGDSTVSSTAGGTDLSPGEAIWIDIANLATINLDAATSGEGVKYLGW